MDEAPRKPKCRPPTDKGRSSERPKIRFTHNEVERKRRARLKSETDFLHQQLPPSNYRDKLAIFKAGTDLLQQYASTNTSESRKLILTEEEYSACVLNNFDGFAVRIRCRDGVILSVNGEIKEHLGEEFADCVGKTLYDYIAADKLAENVIRQNLTLDAEDIEVLAARQTLGRHFVLPLAGPSPNCCFVEFCGDIILPQQQGDRGANSSLTSGESILQALCKRLELCESASAYGVLFSMRLQPGTYSVLEISGRSVPPEMIPEDVMGKSLLDFIHVDFRSVTESSLQKGGRAVSSTCSTRLTASDTCYSAHVNSISLSDYVHCLVVDFLPA
uniref:Aryl hydrocarbon receptor nuclear translocator n=2 Tax=Schistocephalus solidus TaxID=70667 RepID=A0A0X3NUY7_SCHSO